jgi:hypothetical protein
MERPIDIVLFIIIIIFFPPNKKIPRDTYQKTLLTIVSAISKDVLGPQPALEL